MAFCLAQKNSGLMCQTKQIEPEHIRNYKKASSQID